MAKNTKKLLTTLLLIFVLLILAFIPGRDYIANKTFKEALAFNKAISTVSFKLIPEYNGKLITSCDKIVITDLNLQPKKGEKIPLIRYKPCITRVIRAKWVDMKLKGFDKNGIPEYDYVFLVRNYMITVIDVKDSLMGTSIVSVIPNKAKLVMPVKVNMYKVKFKKDKETLSSKMMYGEGGGYTEIEETEEKYGWTDIVNLRSVYGEKSQIVFPRGSVVYIQSKSRGDSKEPITTRWSDAGPDGVQVAVARTSGYEQNGTSSVIKAYIHFMYVRKRIVAETNFGVVSAYEEDVYPISLNGLKNVNAYLPSPSLVQGAMDVIGSSPGASSNFPLYGTSGYYFVPAVSLNFGVNYGENGGSVGISLTLSAEAHYRQNVHIYAEVISSNNGKSLWAFDNNTNWKEVYFKWR